MKIFFNVVLIMLFPTLLPRVYVYEHAESQRYLDMSLEERHQLFTERGQPVIYLKSADKYERKSRSKKDRREWEAMYFTFYYYCPVKELALEKVIVKFSDNAPVIFSDQDLEVDFTRIGSGFYKKYASPYEGRIRFRIEGIETETYIKHDLDYVHFISTKDSPCQLDIKLEGFEKNLVINWAA